MNGPRRELLGLPGIGPVTAQRLREHGLATPRDLLWLLPARYEDRRAVTPISSLWEGQRATTVGMIVSCREKGPKWRRTLEVVLEDAGNKLTCRWFSRHRPRAEHLLVGAFLHVAGSVAGRRGGLEMAHPTIAAEGTADCDSRFGRIVPVYPRLAGVSAQALDKARRVLLDQLDEHIVDTLPEALRQARGLLSLKEALRLAHNPPSDADDETLCAWCAGDSPALRRLNYDALLWQQLSCGLLQKERGKHSALKVGQVLGMLAELAAVARIAPTTAQQRVVAEIAADMACAHPMQRLVQGEVGCGKTLVAAVALAAAARAGHQSVLMAPTAVLAEQHARTLRTWLFPLGIEVMSLTAALSSSARVEVEDLTASGRPLVLVGTHALAVGGLRLPRVALVVIDEQQRFGVAIRQQLLDKSAGGHPHLLVVTATPIPRSLALVLHGDLDLSHIDELPPGRTEVTTRLLAKDSLPQALSVVRDAVDAGQRVFWVCPSIEDGKDELASVQSARDRLTRLLGEQRLTVLTSRLSGDEARSSIEAFVSGQRPVMVATSIVEVGVDVPQATVMVVDGAERFGLSQLHQLRGRVGRGASPSCCLLLHGSLSASAALRLEVLRDTSDGMAVSLADLAQRGPGDILGVRQAGEGRALSGAALLDPEMLAKVRGDAQRLFAGDDVGSAALLATVAAELRHRPWASQRRVGDLS